MAPRKRVAVDTSRLRAMGGEQRVVARPVDSYMRPILREDKTASQIADALARVNPEIQRFLDDEREQYRKDQREAGEKNYYESSQEERDDLEKKIRNGDINELQSKFWVEGFSRSLLRNHAKEYGDDLLMKWDAQKDTAGFDFGNFVTAQREAYSKENNLGGFRADIFNDEFGAVTERFEAQVQQRNYEHRLQKAREARFDSHMGEVGAMLDGWNEQIDAGTWNPAKATEQVNALVKTVMNQGNMRKGTLDATIGFLEGAALEAARKGEDFEPILQVIEGIKLKSSTYGVANKDKVERLRNQLITDKDQADNRDFERQLKKDQREAYDLQNELEKGLIENKFSADWYNSAEVVAKRNRLQVLDEGAIDTVDRFFQGRGQVQQTSDDTTFKSISDKIDRGFNQEDEIENAYWKGLLTYQDKTILLNANSGMYSQFVQKNGLEDVRSGVVAAIKQKDVLGGLLSDQTRNNAASRASQEMFRYIQNLIPQVEGGKLTEEAAIEKIYDKQAEIIEKYRKELSQQALNTQLLDGNGQPVVPSSEEQVANWKQGKSPWINSDTGQFTMKIDDVGAMWDAAKKVLERPDQLASFLNTTDFGRMIAPLVAAGVPQDEIIERFAQDYIKALGGTPDAASKVITDNATVTQPKPTITEAVDAAQETADQANYDATLSGAIVKYSLTPVMRLPESYAPVKRTELTTQNGGFSGQYLYEDANGVRYISGQKVNVSEASGTPTSEQPSVTIGGQTITAGSTLNEAISAVGASNTFFNEDIQPPADFKPVSQFPLSIGGQDSMFTLYVDANGRGIITFNNSYATPKN